MTITNGRAQKLSDFLFSDEEKASHYLSLSPEDAVKEINAQGNDFTVEELIEYGNIIKKSTSQQDELDADDLDNVAGGIITGWGMQSTIMKIIKLIW